MQSLPSSTQETPYLGVFRLESGGRLQLLDRFGIVSDLVQSGPEAIAVIEGVRLEARRRLKFGNAAVIILAQPIGHAQMVMSWRESAIQLNGFLKMRHSLATAIQYSQQKSDLVLQFGRRGIQAGRFFVIEERLLSVSGGLCRLSLDYELLRRLGQCGRRKI